MKRLGHARQLAPRSVMRFGLPSCHSKLTYVHRAYRKNREYGYTWSHDTTSRRESLEDESSAVGPDYQVSDELWERIKPLLPPPKPKKKPERPQMDDRKAMTAIFYVLRTGCQCKALPRSLRASSTVHDRFQEWRKEGVLEKMWRAGLLEYDEKKWSDEQGPVRGKRNRSQSHRSWQERHEAQLVDGRPRYLCR
jgi:transposase